MTNNFEIMKKINNVLLNLNVVKNKETKKVIADVFKNINMQKYMQYNDFNLFVRYIPESNNRSAHYTLYIFKYGELVYFDNISKITKRFDIDAVTRRITDRFKNGMKLIQACGYKDINEPDIENDLRVSVDFQEIDKHISQTLLINSMTNL